MQQLDTRPATTHEELWRKYEQARSIDARNELIVAYSPLVKKIAVKTIGSYRFFSYLDDLVNEGIIALMDAIERFGKEKNVKFETFASIKIKGAMIDFIRKQDCFPRRVKKLARDIADAESDLSNRLGRTPTSHELATHMGVTNEQLDKMQLEVYALNVYSFEQMIYEANAENFTTQFLASNDLPEQHLAESELCMVLSEAIEKLKENEKLVIALHYKEQLKIKDIAAVLKISDSRVSQIHSTALQKLKKAMLEYDKQ